MDEQARRRRAARTLVKGIRGLPERDQDDLLRYLLESAMGAGPEQPEPRAIGTIGPSPIAMSTPFRMGAGGQRMVPFRLPGPLYERLKAWCGANGFAMAVVMRGLVERFLDEQDAAPPRKDTASAKRATRRRKPG